jgi:hypothetical protein
MVELSDEERQYLEWDFDECWTALIAERERWLKAEAERDRYWTRIETATAVAQNWVDRGSSYATPGRKILAALTEPEDQ